VSPIDEEIRSAFAATSLILVFVLALFDLRYAGIRRALEREAPAGEHARQVFRQELLATLVKACGPPLIVSLIAFYLFLPMVVRVIRVSEFDLWDFNFTRTSFVFVAGLVSVFFLWSLYLALSVLRRIRAKARRIPRNCGTDERQLWPRRDRNERAPPSPAGCNPEA